MNVIAVERRHLGKYSPVSATALGIEPPGGSAMTEDAATLERRRTGGRLVLGLFLLTIGALLLADPRPPLRPTGVTDVEPGARISAS